MRNKVLPTSVAAAALGGALFLATMSAAPPPNRSDVPQKLFATGLFDLKTHEGQGAFVDAVVATLHGIDKRWGHLKKKPGQTQVHGHGEDSVLYLADEPGQSTAIDFVGGAGGANPQPGWIVDQPRYSLADWGDPFQHFAGAAPTPPPSTTIPPYAGDEAFDKLGDVLFADYAAAGQAPNPGMGRWFGRTIYDWIAGNTKTLDESIVKHRAEWKAALGLP